MEGDANIRKRASEDRVRLIAQLGKIEATIKQRDPAYWDLVHPEALSLAGVQHLLAADEALLFILTLEKKSYSFAVTAEGATWSRIDGYGTAALAADVGLRRHYLGF